MRAIAWVAGALLLGSMLSGSACAELPALSRPFATERYVTGPQEIAAVRAQRRVSLAISAGAFQIGDRTGGANPFGDWEQISGGRLDLHGQLGRFTVGGEAIGDSPRGVEVGEYQSRLYSTAYVPELRGSATGAFGFEDGDLRGLSLSIEALLLRWKAAERSQDIRPRLWLWTRFAKPQDAVHAIVTPSLGLSIQHLPILGSQAYALASLAADLAEGRLPATQALVQLGWVSRSRPLWGGGGDLDSPSAREPADISWDWFIASGYAFALDDRAVARLVTQAGLRLVRPLGD